MKPFVLLVAFACPLHGEILAHFQTNHGEIIAELQYDKAPRTVANFITLAQGTRAWVDPATGAVKKGPYFNGTVIHRTASNGVDEFAQGGSRLGDGSDGPGYTIKDEFDVTLTHTPYALSMGNAGPNTNGSAFFFTGNVSVPSYDGSYSLFGYVKDTSSRSVVDAMIAAGPNGTTIATVTIERTDAAALAFDENAWNLPVVTPSEGSLEIIRNTSATWRLRDSISTGNILRAFRSTSLTSGSWTELTDAETHVGISSVALTPVVVSAVLDDASAPSAFYNISRAWHPESYAPSHLSNRIVAIDTGGGILTYYHVSSGNGGTGTYTPYGGSTYSFTFNTLGFISSAHAFTFVVQNIGLTPTYLLIRIGCDTLQPTQVNGHHITRKSENLNLQPWTAFAQGAAALSR